MICSGDIQSGGAFTGATYYFDAASLPITRIFQVLFVEVFGVLASEPLVVAECFVFTCGVWTRVVWQQFVMHDFQLRDLGFTGEPNAMPAVRVLPDNVDIRDALDIACQFLQLAQLSVCARRVRSGRACVIRLNDDVDRHKGSSFGSADHRGCLDAAFSISSSARTGTLSSFPILI